MVAPENLMESPLERSASKDKPLSNGNETTIKISEEHKKPSYVALACCISGYSTLSYDSKSRQGLSRSVSPIRGDGFHNVSYTTECGNYLSPIAKEMQSGKGVDIMNGCGGLHSPRRVAQITLKNEKHCNSISEEYSSFSSTARYSRSPGFSPSNGEKNNTDSKLITPTNIAEQLPSSSFIMQRVERLYGPGALAQGFYSPRKSTDNNNKIMTPKATPPPVEKLDDSSLPVLKLLRPEFRAQLTLASRKSKTFQPDNSPLDGDMEKLKIQSDVVDATMGKINQIKDDVRDGHHYLNLLNEQVSILEFKALQVEKELENCENEEVCGILRLAAGKARLLVSQKLNQFRGLCNKNIKNSDSEDFPTTNEDLAGFWDMVMIQILEVNDQFKEINEMKSNNWKLIEKKKPTNSRPGVHTKIKRILPKKKDDSSKARDEARRKLLEEKRRALKETRGSSNPDVILL